MNGLKIFNNDEFGQVRTIEIDGKPYFMASDVAKALGYTNPNKAINDHCRAITKRSTPISGKMQDVTSLAKEICTALLPTVNWNQQNVLKVGFLMKCYQLSEKLADI